MDDELFDLDKLRRRWAPLPEAVAPEPPAALRGVSPAPDPGMEGRMILARVEALAAQRLAKEELAVARIFLRQLEALVPALDLPAPPEQADAGGGDAAGPTPGAGDGASEASTEGAQAADPSALSALVAQVEELFDVYLEGARLRRRLG
jgi:hypothetical protein